VCKALTSYSIDPATCTGCLLCLKNCASEAISGARKELHVIDQAKCNKCGTCFDVCPPKYDAVRRFSGEQVPA
jgi:NADH-quinone oxidoreductase subunit F